MAKLDNVMPRKGIETLRLAAARTGGDWKSKGGETPSEEGLRDGDEPHGCVCVALALLCSVR